MINEKKWNVYVVDDVQENIQVVGNILKQHGIGISVARNGEQALIGIIKKMPDLILLDVTMPGMDGYEVCEKLKENTLTAHIPVIFLTGRTNTEDVLKGFKVGAVDYVTKPFNSAELLSRVFTHLELKDSRDIINKQNQEITLQRDQLSETLNKLKLTQNKLVEFEKMAALGTLVAGVAHEINTPVGIGIQGASTILSQTVKFAEVVKSSSLSRSDLIHYIELVNKTSTLVLSNLQRTAELVKSFKKVSVDQVEDERQRFNIKQYIKSVLTTFSPKLKETEVNVLLDIPEDLELCSYPASIAQLLVNLMTNSLIHGFQESNKGIISIKAIEEENKKITFFYQDNGIGMSAETREKIFDPFFTTNKQKGSGLGMHIAYNIVNQRLGGEITCCSSPNEGVTFKITVPVD